MQTREKQPISQSVFMDKCRAKNIETEKNSFFGDSPGICSLLTNQFIKSHLEGKGEEFFASLRLIYKDDQQSTQELRAFCNKYIELNQKERWLNIKDSIPFNSTTISGKKNKQQQLQINALLENLTNTQAIHVTISTIHSFAIVKIVEQNKTYYKVYDPNNNEEPCLLNKDEVYDEIFNVSNLICLNSITTYLTGNRQIFTFNVLEFNKKIINNYQLLVEKARLDSKDEGENIIQLKQEYFEKKISLITFLKSKSVLQQEAMPAEESEPEHTIIASQPAYAALCNLSLNTRYYYYGSSGTTLLHQAARIGDLACIEYLINNGVKDNIPTQSEELAIHDAITMGHYCVVDYLLGKLKYRKNKLYASHGTYSLFNGKFKGQTYDRKSLLHYAISEKQFKIAKLLLEKYHHDDSNIMANSEYAYKSILDVFAIIPEFDDFRKYLLTQTHSPLREIDASNSSRVFFDEILSCLNRNSIILKQTLENHHIEEIAQYIKKSNSIKVINLSLCKISGCKDKVEALLNEAILVNNSLIQIHLPGSITLSVKAQEKLEKNITLAKAKELEEQKRNDPQINLAYMQLKQLTDDYQKHLENDPATTPSLNKKLATVDNLRNALLDPAVPDIGDKIKNFCAVLQEEKEIISSHRTSKCLRYLYNISTVLSFIGIFIRMGYSHHKHRTLLFWQATGEQYSQKINNITKVAMKNLELQMRPKKSVESTFRKTH